MKIYKLAAGCYEILKNGEVAYRIYRNRWNGWTLAVFSNRHKQFLNSRYFDTLKAAKAAIL